MILMLISYAKPESGRLEVDVLDHLGVCDRNEWYFEAITYEICYGMVLKLQWNSWKSHLAFVKFDVT